MKTQKKILKFTKQKKKKKNLKKQNKKNYKKKKKKSYGTEQNKLLFPMHDAVCMKYILYTVRRHYVRIGIPVLGYIIEK